MEHIINVWNEVYGFILRHFIYGIDENNIFDVFIDMRGRLTLLGTLAVIMAGVSLVLLVFNLIRSFLNK